MNKELDIDEKHQFHDSIIFQVEKKGTDLEIDIQIDTYWFPGKKNGLIYLKNALFDDKMIKYVEDKYPCDNVARITHKQENNKHLFEIVLQSDTNKIWKIIADSFSFERYDKKS